MARLDRRPGENLVNGRHVPYTDAKGKKADDFVGNCQPASFDVTNVVNPGAENPIRLRRTRVFLNESGTGGLLSPALLYREKDSH